ncbi:hypothetical protein Drorol1_Dr00025106 [Drosera rotundifolia]
MPRSGSWINGEIWLCVRAGPHRLQRKANWVLEVLEESGHVPNAITYTIVICGYVPAIRVFDEAEEDLSQNEVIRYVDSVLRCHKGFWYLKLNADIYLVFGMGDTLPECSRSHVIYKMLQTVL